MTLNVKFVRSFDRMYSCEVFSAIVAFGSCLSALHVSLLKPLLGSCHFSVSDVQSVDFCRPHPVMNGQSVL